MNHIWNQELHVADIIFMFHMLYCELSIVNEPCVWKFFSISFSAAI